MRFWLASECLVDGSLMDEAQARRMMQQLVDRFLKQDAMYEININGSLRASLSALPDADNFAKQCGPLLIAARDEVAYVLKQESFISFRQMLRKAKAARYDALLLGGHSPQGTDSASPMSRSSGSPNDSPVNSPRHIFTRRSGSPRFGFLSPHRILSPRSKKNGARAPEAPQANGAVSQSRSVPHLEGGNCRCCLNDLKVEKAVPCDMCRRLVCKPCLGDGKCHQCSGQSDVCFETSMEYL